MAWSSPSSRHHVAFEVAIFAFFCAFFVRAKKAEQTKCDSGLYQVPEQSLLQRRILDYQVRTQLDNSNKADLQQLMIGKYGEPRHFDAMEFPEKGFKDGWFTRAGIYAFVATIGNVGPLVCKTVFNQNGQSVATAYEGTKLSSAIFPPRVRLMVCAIQAQQSGHAPPKTTPIPRASTLPPDVFHIYDLKVPVWLNGPLVYDDTISIWFARYMASSRPFEVDYSNDDDSIGNSWEHVLADQSSWPEACLRMQSCSPHLYLKGIWEPYSNPNGQPLLQHIDTEWGENASLRDGLADTLLFFKDAGVHFTRALTGADSIPRPPSSCSNIVGLAFVANLSSISNVKNRPGYAAKGGLFYFNEDLQGVLILRRIRADDGQEEQVWRCAASERDWQAAAAQMRADFFLQANTDHFGLHMFSSLAVGESLKQALAGSHSLRRFTAMFVGDAPDFFHFTSLWSILAGEAHTATGATNHGQDLSTNIVETWLSRLISYVDVFFNRTKLEAMHPALSSAPIYQDGVLIFDAITEFVRNFTSLNGSITCISGHVRDPELLELIDLVEWWWPSQWPMFTEWLELYSADQEVTCKGFNKFLVWFAFVQSVWHVHAGWFGKWLFHPDLVALGLREGELMARPRVAVFTVTIGMFAEVREPPLSQNTSHLATNVSKVAEADLREVFVNFRKTMEHISKQVNRTKASRMGVTSYDPSDITAQIRW